MKDDNRATPTNRTDDAAHPGDDTEKAGKLVEPANKRQHDRRLGGERRYSHSTGVKNAAKAERRASARRASDKGASDKGNAEKE